MAHSAQIFISYAHADDQPFDEETSGWVTNFVDHLHNALGTKLGTGKAQYWMDHRLEPQRAVDTTLRSRILASDYMIAFMSPRYLLSDWCRQEMDTFIDLVGGGSSNDRVFLVELLPTDRERWHPGVAAISKIQFWSTKSNEPDPMILGWPVPNTKGDRAYWARLNRLSNVIANQITQGLSDAPSSLLDKKSIWIAEPEDDVVEQWEKLATSLRELGFEVAPSQTAAYPHVNEGDYCKALSVDLKRADLLIQLLGPEQLVQCRDATFSISQVQARVARNEVQRRGVPQLVWRSPEIQLNNIRDPTYRQLLTGAIACGIGEFQDQVLRVLTRSVTPSKGPARPGDSLSIIVNADKPDRDLGKSVRDMLFALNVDATLVAEPVPDQPPAEYFQHLDDQLLSTNGFVIVYGAAQSSWVQAQHSRARKTLAVHRNDLLGAVLDGPPDGKPDHEVRSHSLMLLDCRTGLTSGPLQRFVDTLRQGRLDV